MSDIDKYIDLNKAIERLKASPAFPNMGTDGYFLLGVVEDLLKKLPTADVVPKSEVEKLNNELIVWKQNRFNLYQRLECYEMTRQKVAREIFEELDNILYKFAYPSLTAIGTINVITAEGYHLHTRDYSELKKKYT